MMKIPEIKTNTFYVIKLTLSTFIFIINLANTCNAPGTLSLPSIVHSSSKDTDIFTNHKHLKVLAIDVSASFNKGTAAENLFNKSVDKTIEIIQNAPRGELIHVYSIGNSSLSNSIHLGKLDLTRAAYFMEKPETDNTFALAQWNKKYHQFITNTEGEIKQEKEALINILENYRIRYLKMPSENTDFFGTMKLIGEECRIAKMASKEVVIFSDLEDDLLNAAKERKEVSFEGVKVKVLFYQPKTYANMNFHKKEKELKQALSAQTVQILSVAQSN